MTVATLKFILEGSRIQRETLGRQGRFKFKYVPTGEFMSLKQLCRLYGLNYGRTNRRLIGCNALEDSLFCEVGYKGKMGPKTVPEWWGTQIIPMINGTDKEILCQKSIS